MAEEKAALILYNQENEEKTLHPPRGPRLEPQKGKLSSKKSYSNKCKKHVYVEKSVGKKYITL